jgi:Family of unknown function (DUF6525)
MSDNYNSGGIEGITVDDDFECFDRLPKIVRAALANAHEKFSAAQLYNLWRAKTMSANEIVEEIASINRAMENKRARECAGRRRSGG